MTRHLNAKSSIPCAHGIDCIKITFPSCLSMDMVLAWSAASEGPGTEPESLTLNKRQTKIPGAWLQEAGSTEKWTRNGARKPWPLLHCSRSRLYILKWMVYIMQLRTLKCKINIFGFVGCTFKTLTGRNQHSLYSNTISCTPHSIEESGNHKYILLSACLKGCWKIRPSYGSWQLLTKMHKITTPW